MPKFTHRPACVHMYSYQLHIRKQHSGQTQYSTPTHVLFACLTHVGDVGKQVVVFRLGHGLAEFCRVLEHADQDLQTV